MKKVYILLTAVMLMLLSCARPFDSRYYYNKKVNSSESDTGDSDVDIGGGENLSPEEDPFNPNYKGDGYYGWNDEKYIFYGSIIDSWFMKVNFGKGNVPEYRFFIPNDGRSWIKGDDLKNEFNFDARNDGNKVTYPLNVAISDMVVYKYVNKNPLVSSTGEYNKSERLQRFIFMRINGSAANVPMNNYLIAIDKYSKFIFAYAKIVETGSTLGNKYPTKFDAIENYQDRRFFYEYDPIGFVSEDGSVTLFDEYKREMELGATDYVPSIHKENNKPRAIATREKPGRSPYLNLKEESNRISVIVSSKSVKNISIKSYSNPYGFGGYKIKDEAYLVYATRASIYEDSQSKTYEMLGNYGEGKELGFGATANSIITIKNNDSTISEKSTKYSIADIEKAMFKIDIDTKFIKYNWLLGFPDYGGTVTHISDYDNSLLTLAYNPKDKKLSVKSQSEKVISCTPLSFVLEKGKEQEIVVKYKDFNDNRNEEWEITYSIKLE